jgi:hypothetical protein
MNRDHRQHERAGKGGEIAELAGAEDETFVSRVSASAGIAADRLAGGEADGLRSRGVEQVMRRAP